MQHVRALPPSRKVLDLERPKFAWERFHTIANELPPLFTEHWRELALNQDVIPLAPDWDRYYAMDVQGVLRVLTVRYEGRLVGYCFILVGPHLHYVSTPWGHSDMFWLEPTFRQGWTGVHLFKAMLRGVEEMGAKMLTVPVKLHFMNGRVIKLLKRLGFEPIEIVMARRL